MISIGFYSFGIQCLIEEKICFLVINQYHLKALSLSEFYIKVYSLLVT